jgi:putative transposase
VACAESCVPSAYRLPDSLWDRVGPLLPPDPPHLHGGRPFSDPRRCLEGVWYLLRTGGQWCALPRCFGPKSTVHGRFQLWRSQGLFERLWWQILLAYDDEVGIAWTWQSLDGALGKAPLGGTATGPNPTDRGKLGVKRSLLTDGRGVPLAIVAAEANRHDSKLLERTLEARVALPPLVSQHLCLDKGYDFPFCREIARAYLFTPHIRPIGEEPRRMERNRKRRARRWVVERTISWLNRCRRILVRWEKKVENYLAMLELACAWIALQALQRG